ncbi:MAG: rRNA pseudouridine synthase [Clostridia bacterium]|nr:rRNA pseudouridine synthase [Clostridia bacterium]
MRINKYLASAGLASRRKAEELVKDGKVKVNGKVVLNLATDIKDTDSVVVDGKSIKNTTNFVYYKLNKPKGYITTVDDEKGRKTVMSLLRGVHYRVFPVGRLDYDTEGLLLFTNDGEITNILTKPANEIEKTYIATIEGTISADEIKKLSSGVNIGGYVTKPCVVSVIEKEEKFTKVSITITEGKNRQVRKMLESVGKVVVLLRRTKVGEIALGGLSRGEYKALNPKEIKYLLSLKR